MAVIVRNVAEQRTIGAGRAPTAIAVHRPQMSMRVASQACVLVAVWMMAMVVATPRTFAASYTWTGVAGDGLWSTGSNWTPVFTGSEPLELTFDAAGGSSGVNDLTTGTTLKSLTFTATAGASQLSNTDITVPEENGLSVVAGGVVRSFSVDDQEIGFRLNIDNNLEVNVVGVGKLRIGNLGGAAAITKTGTGTLILPESNSYSGFTGNVNVQAGTMIVGPVDASLPDSTVTVATNATLEAASYIRTVVSGGLLEPGTRSYDPSAPLRQQLFTSDLTMQGTSRTEFSISGNQGIPSTYQNWIELTAPSGTASLSYGGIVNVGFENTTTYAIGTTWDLIKTDGTTVADRIGVLAGVSTSGTGPYANLSFTLLSAGTGSGDAVWRSGWAGSTDTMLEFREASGQLVVVPEPSTMVFAGMGAALSGWSMWRRRRAMKRGAARRGQRAAA